MLAIHQPIARQAGMYFAINGLSVTVHVLRVHIPRTWLCETASDFHAAYVWEWRNE